ncbi:hypothetical protein GCM10017643_02220 [Ancylobacter dichloromethanicus]|uniref:Uncharacterized protein n=1 Tax=Ancylobacter dichloromethanicus TaxID=518825 RepID=A0A9W6MXP7_9HYPH|nr:hypothetical protein GCM10017643_02220 [Ancylobacter dichloromethanicus]
MIAIEDQQRALGERVERRRHRAQHGVGIGGVTGILRDRVVDAGQPAGTVGVVRLHGHRHQEQRLAGGAGALDLLHDAPTDGNVADIGAEAIVRREGLLVEESREAEAGNGSVAAEETRIVRMQEKRAPAAGPQRVGQRGLRQPLRAQIGIEPVHTLTREGDAGQHLHFGAVRIGAIAGHLQPAMRQRPAAQAVDMRQGQRHAAAPQISEGFRLQDNDGAMIAPLPRQGSRCADRLPPAVLSQAVSPPEREARDQRDGKSLRGDEPVGRHVEQLSRQGGQQAGDPARQHRYSGGDQQGRSEYAGLRRLPQYPRLHPAPGNDHAGEQHNRDAEAGGCAEADVEQRRVADQRRQEAKVAEHQRLAQIGIFDPRDQHEHAKRDQRRHRGEERTRRQAEPQHPEPAGDRGTQHVGLAGRRLPACRLRAIAGRHRQTVQPAGRGQGHRQSREQFGRCKARPIHYFTAGNTSSYVELNECFANFQYKLNKRSSELHFRSVNIILYDNIYTINANIRAV